jgi:transcriptional regulator with XRE-family HTH domain
MGETQTPASDRLRDWRTERGLNQTQLAELLGCTVGWISQLERGAKPPGVLRVTIEDVTGIPARDWPTAERKKRRRAA